MTPNPECPPRVVLLAAGALGVSCVMTQLALMRELLGAFSGNEMVLGVTLGLWLLLMGIGARLGRTADGLRNPAMVLFPGQILVALLPLAQVLALRGLRNVIFIRGAEVGGLPPCPADLSCLGLRGNLGNTTFESTGALSSLFYGNTYF